MPFNGVGPGKFFGAKGAPIRFFLRMGFDVSVEYSALSETFLALVTFIRFFPGVSPVMPCQGIF